MATIKQKRKPKLLSLRLVGPAYVRGQRRPGWASGRLNTGRIVYVPEASTHAGMNGALAFLEREGVDVTEYRERLDVWVQSGIMPHSRLNGVKADAKV